MLNPEKDGMYRVGEEFQCINLIGTGGYARVYSANDCKTPESQFAVKVKL